MKYLLLFSDINRLAVVFNSTEEATAFGIDNGLTDYQILEFDDQILANWERMNLNKKYSNLNRLDEIKDEENDIKETLNDLSNYLFELEISGRSKKGSEVKESIESLKHQLFLLGLERNIIQHEETPLRKIS